MDGVRARLYARGPAELAELHFGKAQLGNRLRTQRLVEVAEAMFARPGESITQQCPGRTEQTGCYRFLSNPKVQARAMLQGHQDIIRQFCQDQDLTLCVQDTMELSYPRHKKKKGLGPISGPGKGLLQHSALAVSEQGELLGVLDVRWGNRRRRKGKRRETTRQQQQAPGKESAFWSEAAQAIGAVHGWAGTLIQIGDRGSDIFVFMDCCRTLGQGFVVRAQHDRYLEDAQGQRLWQKLQGQPVAARMQVQVHANRGSQPRHRRQARTVHVALRYAQVVLPTPRNTPMDALPLVVTAVLVQEIEPPEGQEPVEWMLLSSEPAASTAEAQRLVRWYSYRWRIEEWHRVMKEGLGLEQSRLNDAQDLQRLAAILCVQAVQLLVLRDLADSTRPVMQQAAAKRVLPRVYLEVVAADLGVAAETLTGKQFWHAVAVRGGWPGNAAAPRPGWITLWRGWREIVLIAETLTRMAAAKPVEK